MRTFQLQRLNPVKVVIVGILVVETILGCGAGPQSYDQDAIDKATARAQKARAIFDKVNGDYQAISPGDKADLLKLSNNDENSLKKLWQTMAHPPGAGANGSSPK